MQVDDVVGTVKYTPAKEGSTSVDYVPGAGAVTLSATDASGAQWTLQVPDGALSHATTLRMTPLASVDAKLPGPVAGGILLEPEGTQFIIPVIITVNGGAGILHGDQAGDVRIAMPGVQGWGSAVLQHFSIVLSFIPDDAVWLPSVREMAEETGRAYEAAKQLLKQPVGAPPSAPSITWECRDDAGWAKVSAKNSEYVAEFFKPEGTLVQQLLAGKRMAQLAELKYDETYEMERKLLDRLAKKAGMAMDATKGQPDKILPVIEAVLRTMSSMSTLGSDPQPLYARIAAWIDTSIDPVVKAVARDHDYQQVAVVWEIARIVQLHGGKRSVESIEAKLRPAMRFDAKVKLKLENTEAPTERWDIGGRIPLEYAKAGSGRLLVGEALIDYEGYHHDQGVTLEAPSFLVEGSVVNVDWCKGTATFVVDRMGGDTEARVMPNGTRFAAGYAGTAFGAHYQQYEWRDAALERAGFGFPVKIHNGKVTWIDESFDSKRGADTASFEVTVEHTPKS